MTLALSVTGLVKSYGRFEAVRGVDLCVPAGNVVGLLGPNGSGKSSILHCVTGVLAPTRGRLEIAGHPHSSAAAKRALGFVPDDLALPTNLTGAEFLDLVRRLQPAADLDLLAELVDLLGLGEALGKLVSEYSHGMKRKLQMAAALSHSPALLILDEPFRGLDPEAHVVLRSLLEFFIAAGGAALVATHDLASAQGYCDSTFIVSAGDIVASGAPDELVARFGRQSLEEVFLVATGLEERTRDVRRRVADIVFAVSGSERVEVEV
ncbi:ABC transporter ATP-binding protein [Acidothermaceae bacterium B102]|nr:ABC transporter ATP-binding protein [Acidothermaceae bacterium B102]